MSDSSYSTIIKVTYKERVPLKHSATGAGLSIEEALKGRLSYHVFVNAEYSNKLGWIATELFIEPYDSSQDGNTNT